MIQFLLRLFAYLFSTGIAIGCALLGLVSLLVGASTLSLDVIPWWSGDRLAYALAGAGLFGIVASWWAMRGKARLPLLLWNFIIFGVLAYGYYYSSYKFEGWDHFRQSYQLTGAAAVSLLGSISQLFRKR